MVLLTLDEIAKHNTEGDCWLVIRDKVYDVTSYLDDHPGGVEIVVDVAGKDATEDYDDVGHSDEAHGMLVDYYIGDLNGDSDDPNKSHSLATEETKKAYIQVAPKEQKSEEPNYMLYAGIAVAVAAVGFFVLRKK